MSEPQDAELVASVLAGHTASFETLLRRHNQRVYRTVRGVIRDEAEVEDVMQTAYVAAFEHLGELTDRAGFAGWTARIALNEALARHRRAKRAPSVEIGEDIMAEEPDPERQAAGRELWRLLEQAIDGLPEHYRTTLMLREVEGLSTAEAAEVLGVGPDVVKTRLHRARGLLGEQLETVARSGLPALFRFEAPRCDRVVASVMATLTLRGS